MTDVTQAIAKMQEKFNPAAASGLDLVFGFRIDDDQHFSLTVKDGTCALAEGENADANVTLVTPWEVSQVRMSEDKAR